MEYSAANLELSILGFSEKAVASIDVTAKALRRLASSVDKINNTQFVYAGDKLEVIFTKIARATNAINTTNITNLASAAKSLSSISRLSSLDKMDFEKVGNGFNTLSVAIQPFLDKVKEAEASLTALDGVLKRSSGKKIQGLLGGGATDNKKGGFLGFAKLGVNLYMLRRMGRFMGNLVQAGSDYVETLNLWQVAMRDNLDVADQFINKMNKAYGISTKTLMNAQAIFKNMIGSLGQISDETAYKLSEALVQMSADFSSLYNVPLQSAFEKMQSMLAGQVRPIRSAGLDMTETTLFMFYQQLGGTKTMRQLNRTEKQLLSILAVYQQMGSAGALGDMTKTLNSFANQSRMMTQYWQELKAWSGLLLKDLLEDWQVLIYINAALITMTEIVKAIAKSRGLGEENFIDGMFESTEATNDAVDELQGKLLDFDKFRSLEGTSASPLAIDEKLLEAITNYSSQVENARNAANELAEQWMIALGWTRDENGELVITEDNLKKIKDAINGVTTALGALIALGVWSYIVKIGTSIYKYGIVPLISLGRTIISHITPAMAKLAAGFLAIGIAVKGAFFLIENWGDMSSWQQIIGVIGVATTAILGLAMAFGVFNTAWSLGLATAGIIAGIGAIMAVMSSVRKEAETPIQFAAVGASDLDGGTLFVAGEMGKTEAVFTGANGKTNVANIQQMKAAYSQSLNEWWAKAKYDIPAFQGVSDSGIYTIVDGEARRRGKKFVNV